jgi:hypothetical protein
MIKLQLYIGGQRVDLFDDETVSLTQTIQNIMDIGKVFTDFSKPFTLPASKTNNKIFEHYYNFNIVNGFDARIKVAASIDLNDVPFNNGKIKLEGVDLKSNKPYAYRVVYYGNTVNLKDVLGEDSLGALSWLGGFQREYTSTNVRTDLQAAGVDLTNSLDSVSYTGAFCMPLITTNTRLFWDSAGSYAPYFETDGTINDDLRRGNVYYDAAEFKGLYYEELKYAIRVYLIIKAIEETYEGITFSADSFFKDTSNAQFYDLYMWMHREKGFAFTADDVTNKYVSFPSNSVAMQRVISAPSSLTVFNLRGSETLTYNLSVDLAPAADYSISIHRNGSVYQQGSFTGGTSGTALSGLMVNGNYEVFVTGTTTQPITLSWIITDSALGQSNTYAGTSQQLTATPLWNAQQQVPDIKIIDFLTGLFKMFNLTAFINQAGEIVVKTIDSYYGSGGSKDITDYVDIRESSVDPVIPFKEIKFEYEGRGTKLAQLYEQEQGKGWGTEEYRLENDIPGEIYSVSVPFEHMHYDTIPSGHQVGYCIDDNEDPYIGEPVVFYTNVISTVTPISFLNSSASVTSITNTCSPSNSVSLDATTDDDTCHFSVEINEYSSSGNFDGSLFANYYQNYILNTLDSRRRITKVNAQLPVSFLLNYSLADKLLISDRQYIINSITTDLVTGKSELELLNVVEGFFEVPDNGNGGGEQPGTVTVSVSGQVQPIEQLTYNYIATVGGTAEGTPTYSWSVVGGTINGSNTNSSVSIAWNAVNANSPGSVTCTVTKGNLTPVSNTLNVTIQNSVAAFDIQITENGSTTLTTPVTEGDPKTYGIETTGDTTNVSYTWSIVGGTITSGQGTSSVNVTWDTPTINGYIQVNAFRNGTEFLDFDRYDIVVNAAAPSVTFGIAITNVSSPVLEGSVITYGTTESGTASGTINYTWTVVGGSFSGQGTSSITVTWDTPGAGSIRVDATREGVGAFDQDPISVTALQTTATITGDFTTIIEGNSRNYGSTIGGNTSGTITYSWSASGGTITSGQGTANVSVLWTEPGTATLFLTATREGRSGNDSDSLTVLPIYYIFNACDGGTTVIDRLGSAPTLANQRYVDFSTNPFTYYTYSGFTQNDSSGYPIVDLQTETPAVAGCPAPEPPPLSTLTIVGDQDILGTGESGVVYALDVDPNTVSWQLTDQALSGFNPIDITFVSSTSGTGDTNFSVNFGAYTGNGSETLRSQIIATELNPTSPNPASVGSITISQSPPPTASLNVYARANLVTASRTFEYTVGGAYTPIATATITQSCSLIGTVTGITPGATVTLITSPTNELLGNNTSSCPGDFTSPSGATTYSITVQAGSNDVALNVDTVAGTFALTVAKSLVDGETACSRYASGITGTSYFDEASLFGSNAVFADVNGYSYAAASWFSDGLDFRYWNGTSFTSGGVCSGGGEEP